MWRIGIDRYDLQKPVFFQALTQTVQNILLHIKAMLHEVKKEFLAQ